MNDFALLDKLRLWCIRLIAGRKSVLINAKIINGQIHLSSPALVMGVNVVNDPQIRTEDAAISIR